MKKLIIGLGNPDDKYKNSRHNTGFLVVDNIAQALDLHYSHKKKLFSDIAENDVFIFAKPLTYMNNSGRAVSAIMSFYKVDIGDLVVIHDDADLPFGQYKIQFSSGAAGHHGVESVIQYIGTKDFWRARIGIGRSVEGVYDIEHWVLTDFSSKELEVLKELSYEIKNKFNID